jgi:hypothetical protein
MELNRTSHFECARQDLLSPLQIAKLDEDLPEGRQRHGEAVP